MAYNNHDAPQLTCEEELIQAALLQQSRGGRGGGLEEEVEVMEVRG